MYTDDDLLMLSGLQHMLYCPRQCALIHVAQEWSENRFTAEGQVLHERADKPGHTKSGNVKTEYAVPIRSLSLGLTSVLCGSLCFLGFYVTWSHFRYIWVSMLSEFLSQLV